MLRWLFGGLTAGLLAWVGLQLAVDPYGVWGTPPLACCTTRKVAQLDTERLFKPYQLTRQPARVVWLGSSRVHTGFAATWPGVPDQQVYNLALDGLHVPELVAMVDFLLARPETTPEVLVLGVDLFMVSRRARAPRRGFSQARLDTLAQRPVQGWWLQFKETVLARQAVVASIRTLLAGAGPPVSVRGHDVGTVHPAWEDALAIEDTTTYAGFSLSQHDLDSLVGAVHRLRENGVEVVVFTPPIHDDLQALVDKHGLTDIQHILRQTLSIPAPLPELTADRSAFSDPGHIKPGVRISDITY